MLAFELWHFSLAGAFCLRWYSESVSESRWVLERPEKQHKATEYFNRPEKQQSLLRHRFQAFSVTAGEQEQGLDERNRIPHGYCPS